MHRLVVNGSPFAGLGSLIGGYVPVLVTDRVSGVPVDELRCLLGEIRSPVEDGRVPLQDERPCYDLTTGAPAVTGAATSDTTTTATTIDPTTTTTATETSAPVGTAG